MQVQAVWLLTRIDQRSTVDVASQSRSNVCAGQTAGGVDEESRTVALPQIAQPRINTRIRLGVIWAPSTSGDL